MDGGNNRLKVTVLAGVVSKAISMVANPRVWRDLSLCRRCLTSKQAVSVLTDRHQPYRSANSTLSTSVYCLITAWWNGKSSLANPKGYFQIIQSQSGRTRVMIIAHSVIQRSKLLRNKIYLGYYIFQFLMLW